METKNELIKQGGFDLTNQSSIEAGLKACEIFTNSMLVPEMYREGGVMKKSDGDGKPVVLTKEQAQSNVFIALNMAVRMGIDPLMVMQNLYIVKGKPSWSSSFLISTVNSCGRFKPLRFFKSAETDSDGKYEMVTLSGGRKVVNISCYAYTCPKNVPADKEQENMLYSAKISLKMAMEEGWYNKPGSKWLTMPEQMLMYRAASFWVRTYAPEISMGMYTAEENIDIADASFEEVRPSANMGGEISIKLDDEPVAQPEEEPKAEPKPEVKAEAKPEAKKVEEQNLFDPPF